MLDMGFAPQINPGVLDAMPEERQTLLSHHADAILLGSGVRGSGAGSW
ncbi:MAG: hypothetical protein U0361_07270 [Nitrospiraceae bacterium]